MNRSTPRTGRRYRVLRPWVTLLVLPAALIVGCGENHINSVPVPTAPPTAVPTRTSTSTPVLTPTPTTTGVTAACQKLSSCDQCFINERGVCISTQDCAARISTDIAGCINAVTGCSQGALGDCMPLGCDGGDSTGVCE